MTTTTTNSDAAAVAVDWLPINPNIVPLQGWQAINPDVGGRHSYLIEYYKAQGKLKSVTSGEGSPDEVFVQICKILG